MRTHFCVFFSFNLQYTKLADRSKTIKPLLCAFVLKAFHLLLVSPKEKNIARRVTEKRTNERKGKKRIIIIMNEWKPSSAIIIKCNLICFYQIIQKRLKWLLLVSNLSWHSNRTQKQWLLHTWCKATAVTYHTMTICIFIAPFGCNGFDEYYAYHETLSCEMNECCDTLEYTYTSLSTNYNERGVAWKSGKQYGAEYK